MLLTYWISTTLISVYLLLSAYTYLFSASTIEGVQQLGFPDHFRIQLAVLKILGAIVLITPGLPMITKEWAYAGTALFIITAVIAHYAHKDPIWLNLINVVLFGVLVLSRWSLASTS